MTTDPFTDAAEDRADELWPYAPAGIPLPPARRMDRRIGFRLGAQWARDRLAAQEDDGHDGWCGCGCQDAQEPTDAGPHELDESAPVRNLGYYRSSARCKCGYEVIWGEHDGDAGLDEAWRAHLMRSAVHALRAARRDEEKRNG